MFKNYKLNLRSGRLKRSTEYLIKWKGEDEYGDPWSSWEPAECVNAPELYAKFLAKRDDSDIPYYDEEDEMWINLPDETVSEDKLEELAGYTIGRVRWTRTPTLSSSDEDEV